MITDKEYFLLTFLSYSNFDNKDIGKNLYETFFNSKTSRLHTNSFVCLTEKNKNYFIDYFAEELKKWEVFYIDDRRYSQKTSSKTSYYSVCFKNSEDFYVLTYRGSEFFPLEEAYLDFIQTDLVFGVGIIPEQFYEGIETYNYILKNFNLDREKLILTGHSLGGGIAQYVILNSFIKDKYIPKGKLFNSIGIKRKHIFKDEAVINNSAFNERVVNYGHSLDFTNTVFKHFAKSIKLDKNFLVEDKEKNIFLKKIKFLNKNLYTYHHDDIFLPFFSDEGNFEDKIDIKFIASSIRKLIKKDGAFENKFLAFYFSDKDFDDFYENEQKYIRTSILKVLEKEDNFLYKKHIVIYLENADYKEYIKFYAELKNKMPSPYQRQDIFDVIVFNK